MKPLLTIVVFLFSLSYSMAQADITIPIDGTQCSNFLFEALLNENHNAVEKLITNDFTLGFQGRTLDGATLKQALINGELVIDSGILRGANSRDYNNTTIVSGYWNVAVKLKNNSFNVELAYLSVCVKVGSMWKVAAVQLTPVQ